MKKLITLSAVLLLVPFALLLPSCAKSDILNASITRSGYQLHRDIAYGSEERQKLDIYVPDNANAAPVVVFFYGGSWQFGSKNDYRFVGQALASEGFVAVIADYRLYPEVYFPDFVNDGARAVNHVHNTIANYGGDPKKLFVAGHSAGAYIALMLSADAKYLTATGRTRDIIRGVIGIAGPYDFLPLTDPKIIALFSKAPDAQTQPINHITGKLPPALLVTPEKDDVVSPKNTYNVDKKLKSLRSPVIVHTYPDTDHIGIIVSLAEGFRHRTPLLKDISAFVKQHSAKH